MMNQATINKLLDMRLSAMAESYRNQMQDKDFASV